jgi:hypothetical protein
MPSEFGSRMLAKLPKFILFVDCLGVDFDPYPFSTIQKSGWGADLFIVFRSS